MKNKYEKYGIELENKGFFKPVYKDDKITICNVCDYCYYIIYNEPGIAINIRPETIINTIKDPLPILELYSKMAYADQLKISFIISQPNLEKVLFDVQSKVKKQPKLSIINSEVEKQIIQEFGMTGKKI